MKKLLLAGLLFLTGTAHGESTKTVFNPFTGKLDYITSVNSTNFASGSGVTVSCTNGVCTFTGSGWGGYAVQPATVSFNLAQGVTGTTGTWSGGVTAGSVTVNGSGNGLISLTISGSSNTVLSSSSTIATGHFLIMGSTNYQVTDGGTSAGGGTPASPTNSVQYNGGGSFAGSNNFQFNGTSITILSSVSINNSGVPSSNSPIGTLDVFLGFVQAGASLFTAGDGNQTNQFMVPDQQPVIAPNGGHLGEIYVGGYGGANNKMIFSNSQDFYSQYINFSNNGEMDFRTAKVSESGIGGSMVFSPAGVSEVTISSFNVTFSTSITALSSVTINSQLTVSSNTALNGVLAISSNVTLSGAAGSNGQVLTSGGPNTVPTWTTVSGAGGGIVSPGTFTWTNNSFGASFSTVTVSTLTVTIKAILPGATFYINRAAGATTQEVDVSSLSVKNGLHSFVNAGDGSDGLIIDQNDTTNNKDGIIVNSSGTGNGFLVNGNGVNYGTSSGSSGAALFSCANPVTDGYCAQVYSNQGALGDLFAPLFVSVNNAAFDNPSFYIQSTTSTSAQNGIRIDAKDYVTFELIDTLRSGVGNLSHNGKFQFSSHNDSMRFERRCPVNSDGFCSAFVVDDSTGVGIAAFANDYSRPVSTVDIQGSLGIGLTVAGNTAAPVSGLLVQGNSIFQSSITVNGASTFKSSVTVQGAISISSTVLISNAPGTSGQVLTSGGQGAVASWTTPSAGGSGYALQPATVTINANVGIQATTATFSSSVTIQGAGGLGVTYGAIVGSITANGYAYVVGTSSTNLLALSTSTSANPLVSVSSTPASSASDFLLKISSVSGTVNFGVQNNSHVISSGTTPTVSSCGTSPSMDTNSTDFAGTINTGSASPTACTLTFASPFANTPVCVVSDDLQTAEPAVTSRSTTAITVTLGAALSSGHLFYICVGQKG